MFFSIITPTYNRAKLLPRAIESVLRQDFTDWEMIIVDDGSTDETASVVEKYLKKDGRVKYFRKPNGGVGSARNLGVEKSSGDYLIFLDSDDELLAGALGVVGEVVKKNPDIDLFFFGTEDKNSNKLSFLSCEEKMVDLPMMLKQKEIKGEFLPVTKSASFKKYHGFPTDINGGENLLWWAMLKRKSALALAKSIRLYHFDAANSLCRSPLSRSFFENARHSYLATVEKFGSDLAKYNPRFLGEILYFLARAEAVLGLSSYKTLFRALKYKPFDPKGIGLYLLALLDRSLSIQNALLALQRKMHNTK